MVLFLRSRRKNTITPINRRIISIRSNEYREYRRCDTVEKDRSIPIIIDIAFTDVSIVSPLSKPSSMFSDGFEPLTSRYHRAPYLLRQARMHGSGCTLETIYNSTGCAEPCMALEAHYFAPCSSVTSGGLTACLRAYELAPLTIIENHRFSSIVDHVTRLVIVCHETIESVLD